MKNYVFILMLLVGVTSAISLTTCANLTSPNTVYTLVNDVIDQPPAWQVSHDACFYVSAENVTLDCNNHNISLSSIASQTALDSDYNGTTIRNCKILNYDEALDIGGPGNQFDFTASNLEITNGYFSVYETSGVSISGVSFSCSISFCKSSLDLGRVNSAAISGINSVTDYYMAAYFGGLNNSIISSSTFFSQANNAYNGNGARFDGDFTNVSVYANTFKSFFYSGIYLSGGAEVVYDNITFTENTIQADSWITNDEADEYIAFNTSTKGNKYFLLNGTAAYSIYDIKCNSTAPTCRWATSGSDLPFNATTVTQWTGYGSDWHPETRSRGSGGNVGLKVYESIISVSLTGIFGNMIFIGLIVLAFFAVFLMLQGARMDHFMMILFPAVFLTLAFMPSWVQSIAIIVIAVLVMLALSRLL
jgi:hypothetical protein